IVPPGVINVVVGPGAEVGMVLASSKRIDKVAFTGETTTGRLIMGYAAQNLIPSHDRTRWQVGEHLLRRCLRRR
ncbi:MAG TPA: aldehyde dehydrogenase family protein, partial [Candidatus Limnocylindrales bacterium]